MNGWNVAKASILIVNKNPKRNKESEYMSIKTNRAIVLNHSPNIETMEALQNFLYFLLFFSNEKYET